MLLSGCAAELRNEGRDTAWLPNDLPVVLGVQSLEARRFLTVVRQNYDFSCGSAALATLLRYHYSDPQTEQTVFLSMWRTGNRAQIQRLGFSLLDMKRYLASRGMSADGYKVTLEQMRAAGTPGIALLDIEGYKHFVTVKGIANGTVLVGDPALGIRRMTQREFLRSWNGVLFVINSADGGSPAFDTERDWGLASGAPIRQTPAMSLQALALTRPLPGDF